MFGRASREIKGIKVDDGFDDDHAVARAVRRLIPPESGMRPGAHDRLKARLLAIRDDAALGVPEAEGRRAERAGRRRLMVFTAVAAAMCLLAAVAVPVLLSVFRGDNGTKPAEQFARVGVHVGFVEVRDGGGRWRRARAGEMLPAGSAVRTSALSFASVEFPDGSAMRVTDGSEVRINEVGKSSAVVEHVSGGTYHRVEDGADYVVLNSDVQTRSAGAVFNIENRVPGSLEIVTLDRAVAVEIGEHRPITVSSGEVMVVAMAGDKKADKQPVSRERLEEDRLFASASEDAKAGRATGIYEQLDVPMDGSPSPVKPPDATVPALALELKGAGMETGGSLSWSISGEAAFDTLVLLRSVASEPAYPAGEIARYADTSIDAAADNSVLQEHTYQYRVAALKDGAVVAYSNTLIVTIPKSALEPARASLSLIAKSEGGKVHLEWSVTDASGFSGFALERAVDGAPEGAKSQKGSRMTVRIDSRDILNSYVDTSVEPGCVYTYRVALVVEGSLMVYSNSTTTVR